MKRDDKNLITRPPVVVVLGHVDHGKSSLLEAIRDFKITSKESGGITQHIGAYEVEIEDKKITFIDTPGHEAFCAMRSRGAKVADIAILVVAGEEGVKPQTKEAIKCIKEENISAILAINKMDKQEANAQKVKNALAKENFIVEDLGGSIPAVETSATQKTGIKELLEMILLVAEMQNLNTEFNEPAQGVVIETHINEKRGSTATLLVKNGTLKLEDVIITKSACGKIKKMEDFMGNEISEAYSSKPVAVLGFEGLPEVGEHFKVCNSIEEARAHIVSNKSDAKESSEENKDKKILKIIIKTDVLGSLGAIEKMIKDLHQEEIAIQILRSGAGAITEEDVQMAYASGAKIFSFHAVPTSPAANLANQKRIKIFSYDVIYELIDHLKKVMKIEVESEIVRRDLGKLKILKVFRTEKDRQIVGGSVIGGEILNNARIEVFRNDEIIGRGRADQLQKEKKNIEKAVADDEVGILYIGSGKIEEGDILQFFVQEKKKFEF
ncbi:translation initiation factor IF-2 [Patescibacteria group bacterium]|nr:translation initiation factor IF-2 [Patescibacteria group bacterium]